MSLIIKNQFSFKALFIDSYVKRTDMNIARTPSGSPQAGNFI
jgi:hypothetical protein